ncbi:tRNA (N6-threonylcarbamoyladenosine(37)-N6)-methyltransferase TrmO [Halobacterium sp. KA-4]|jgi:tRNA-Thr(GGU) m(6)t(6)A37 methyltransferase TsaA|uniref:tRNA (N6-threonylcarbamoyladenosine(37)-N6)-methyltransferase TrmO n=1 Tax=Halobacterium sp. KA-4 TaxID=2896367 RepID=UPI001E28AB71|nr:tRNA (N6-threonylcarbamoyladenosine(37)-N6)-methyltransferase TrmO [Halobacterium sp. KA-4]MCD2199472.1 tRNA (N6-threonylcarbamoyladenosine(37)-N6)-methyltransferase TrmO [Halobacterium sp. KA-4]
MECAPIGRVETPFAEAADAPRQGFLDDATGTVHVAEPYREGLSGLDAGHTIDVVWWADDADRSVLRVRDGDRGVFTTRSQARPNPVCVTTCDVLDVHRATGTVDVSGVDMGDGSPVLDLKYALDSDERA